MSYSYRRKGPTPTVDHLSEDAWDQVLNHLGFEAMTEENRPVASVNENAATNHDNMDPGPGQSMAEEGRTKKKLELMDLPLETQKQIFGFSTHPDLIALSLVSKNMRDIAAAHLYRSFHIVFPDYEDPANDYPIDSLAGGLDTFVTSEYDYAKYLRKITLESLSSGLKGETAYRYYLYDASCGKFLNTLLLLTLRKARALEKFKWDIRVELSREVFKALHQTQALKHLHLRMQAGESIYQIPPPLPNATFATSPSPYASTPTIQSGYNSIPVLFPMQQGYSASSFSLISKTSAKAQQKNLKSPSTSQKTPPTISGFKNLNSLSILDMDSHEYIDEVKICLENSSSTLSTLRLSFSELFAGKTRKPPPDPIHSDDESDIEDEFGQLVPPPPPPGTFDTNMLIKAQEESKKQDAALGKIFGIDPVVMRTKSGTTEKLREILTNDTDSTQPIRKLVNFYGKFMSQVKPGGENTPQGKEALEEIEKATRKFLDILENSKPNSSGGGSDAVKGVSASSGSGIEGNTENEATTGGASNVTDAPGLFDAPKIKKKEPVKEPGVSNPDDIDVEEPESEDLNAGNDANPDSVMDLSSKEDISIKPRSGPEQHLPPADFATEQEMQVPGKLDETTEYVKTKEGPDGTSIVTERPGVKIKEDIEMSQYIRKTRGLTLKTLSIDLIPTRASILAKAVDLSVLQNITLLSVGSQTSFWNHLSKENKQRPLALRKIHTDNVTLPFLNLISELKHLQELYMLERLLKRGEIGNKTTVTMEQIRKAVLKKHASTLKVLMVRNDLGNEWDFNVKAVMLLCQSGTRLEELTATFASKALHSLLQFFSGLTSLRALHVLVFRHQDNCDFTRVELPRLVIDTASSNPDLKLEYLACIDTVERLVRRKIVKVKPRTAEDKKTKAKQKMKALQAKWGLTADMLSVEYMHGTAVDAGLVTPYEWQDSSDDEVENMYGKNGLKIETLLLRPCDVVGVKIFEKEILTGRL